MAPGFLSKFVKSGSTNSHHRERSDRSIDGLPNSSSSLIGRARALSAGPVPSSDTRRTSTQLSPNSSHLGRMPTYLPTSSSTSISSTDQSRPPSVTVVPPSPLIGNGDLSSASSQQDLPTMGKDSPKNSGTNVASDDVPPRNRTFSAPEPSINIISSEESLPTPTPNRSFTVFGLPIGLPGSRAPSPSSSVTNLRETAKPTSNKSTPDTSPEIPSPNLEPQKELRHRASSKSLRQPVAPVINTSHFRAATAPAPPGNAKVSLDSQGGQDVSVPYTAMSPIVESPTAAGSHEMSPNVILAGPVTADFNSTNTTPTTTTSAYTSSTLLSAFKDSDSISINSTTKDKEKDKKRPWRRSTAGKKPTGLASAIAASGLAMANPSMSAVQQAQFSPPPSITPSGVPSRKHSNPSSPIQMPRSPTNSAAHGRNGSMDFYPNGNATTSSVFGRRRRSNSNVSPRTMSGDDRSELFGQDDRPDYYSGLEDGSSEDDGGSASDDFADMDGDIPVTGFAVANNKRNADFHQLFPAIPEADYLIEDYGCALQREILVQGRIYISENHICFHSNILGWVTDLLIPISEITSLEKKTTVLFIPNAIQITTRQAKYTFASFLARDTTFDVIYNIWRIARPQMVNGKKGMNGKSPGNSPRGSLDNGSAPAEGAKPGLEKKVTQCKCGKSGQHYPEVALEATFPGTPEMIYNLIFASGFIKEFMAVNQKLLNIQMSDWSPIEPGSHLLTRQLSYIKPLNNSMGPRQTKCEIRDDTAYCDFDDYVSTVTTTTTPDVPSGKVFEVKTRTCIMWASAVSSKVIVSTQVEWNGRSYIKSIIERSAIDGQKTYHGDLDKAMRAYINEHRSEFVPAGVDASAIPPEAVAPSPESLANGTDANGHPLSEQDEKKQRERERNWRSLQWAWDTFEGAGQVASASARTAWDLVSDAWDQSSSTTILYFVIAFLVLSNAWTLMKMGAREEVGRRKELKKMDEREQWIHGVVNALWDELNASGMRNGEGPFYGNCGGGIGIVPPGVVQPVQDGPPSSSLLSSSVPATPTGHLHFDANMWHAELKGLQRALDVVEERVKAMREGLTTVGKSLHDLD